MSACGYHQDVLAAMAAHGHVDDEATAQAERDLSRQCPQCVAETRHSVMIGAR